IQSNAYGTTTSSETVFITEAGPSAGFSESPTSGYGVLTVNFTDTTGSYYGSMTSWGWNFGDGGSSNVRSPQHVYGIVSAPTTYMVVEIVSTNFGVSTSSSSVSVTEPAPGANGTGLGVSINP